MKRALWTVISLFIPVLSLWAGQVTVNQSGSGNYTTISAAISAGETNILITDSGHYVETVQIGNPTLIVGGPPVFLGASRTGANRPVITPPNGNTYSSTIRANHFAGFGLFADNSVISNLVLEANPDAAVGTTGPLLVMATNVLIVNCKFEIAAGTTKTLGSGYPLLDFAQQGDPTSHVATPGGPDCNGCLVRNCEFLGVATNVSPLEPIEGPASTDGGWGYLGQKAAPGNGTGQGSGYARVDFYSDGRPVLITFEGCYFHYDRDYGIFVTDNTFGAPTEPITVTCNKCRFDAQGKFQIRGRGGNVYANNSIFTRCLQSNTTDAEDGALAVENQNGNQPSGGAFNCLFVNCGSADWGQSCYGAVLAYNSAGLVTVNQCTFVDCLNAVTCGAGSTAYAYVTNCIFHEIGANVPPCVDANGITLTNGSPELVGGLYPAWTNGLPHWLTYTTPPGTNTAVFNDYRDLGVMTISNCMVGNIASEDTNSWDVAQTTNILGCRLYAGSDSDFTGTETVTRAIPVFLNRNPDALNPFRLAPSSPGQGMGANLTPLLEPKLSVSQTGSTVAVSWTQPIWVTGYSLQSTPSLATPVWTPVAGVLDAGGGSYTVPVSVGSGNQYFAVRPTP